MINFIKENLVGIILTLLIVAYFGYGYYEEYLSQKEKELRFEVYSNKALELKTKYNAKDYDTTRRDNPTTKYLEEEVLTDQPVLFSSTALFDISKEQDGLYVVQMRDDKIWDNDSAEIAMICSKEVADMLDKQQEEKRSTYFVISKIYRVEKQAENFEAVDNPDYSLYGTCEHIESTIEVTK